MSAVTLQQLKSHLRITHNQSDSSLQLTLDAVEEIVEGWLATPFTPSQKVELLDGNSSDFLPLSWRPVTAVTTVTDLYDDIVIGSGEYRIAPNGLYLRDSAVWEPGAVRFNIQYTAGYTAMPAGVKLIVLKIASKIYANPEGAAAISGGQAEGKSWASEDSELALLLARYDRRQFA